MEKIVSLDEEYECIKILKEALLKIFNNNYNYNDIDYKHLKKCVYKLVNKDYSDKLYVELYNIIYEYIIHIKNKILKSYEFNLYYEKSIPTHGAQKLNKMNFSFSRNENRDLELYFSYNKSSNNFIHIKKMNELNNKNYKKYSYDKFMIVNNLKLFFENNENNYFNDQIYDEHSIFFKSYLYSKNLINFKNILFSNCIKLEDTSIFNRKDNICLNNFKNRICNKITNLFYKYSYCLFLKEKEYLIDQKDYYYNINSFIHLQCLCLENLTEIHFNDEKYQEKVYLKYIKEIDEEKKDDIFYILKDDHKMIQKYKKFNYENLYSKSCNINKRKYYYNIFDGKKNKEVNQEEYYNSDDSATFSQKFALYFNKTDNIYKKIDLYEIFKFGLSVENNLLFNSKINKKEKAIEDYNITSIYLRNKNSIENKHIFRNKVNHNIIIIKDLIYFLIHYKLSQFSNIIRIAIISLCILIGRYISSHTINFNKQNKFEYRVFNNILLLYYMIKKQLYTFNDDMNKTICKFLDILSINEYVYFFLKKKIVTLKKIIKHHSKLLKKNVLEKQYYLLNNEKHDYTQSENYSNDNNIKNILIENIQDENEVTKNWSNCTEEKEKVTIQFNIYNIPLKEINILFYSILMFLKNSEEVYRLSFLKNVTEWNYFSIIYSLINSNKYNKNIYKIIKKRCLKTKENAINYYTCNEKKMCIIITNKILMNIYRIIACKFNYNYKYKYNILLNYIKLYNVVIFFWRKWINDLKNINEIFTYMYDNFINNKMYKRKYFLKKNYMYIIKNCRHNFTKKNLKESKIKEHVRRKKHKKTLLHFDSLGIFLFSELILNNVFIKKVIKKCIFYYYTFFNSHKKEIYNFLQIIFYLDKLLGINYYYNYFEFDFSLFYFIYITNIMHKIIEYKNLSYFLNFMTNIMFEKIYFNKGLHIFNNFHTFKKYIITNSFTKKHSIMFLNKYKKEIFYYFQTVKYDELQKLYSIINTVLKSCKQNILSLFEDAIISEFNEKLKNHYIFFPKKVWNNFLDIINSNFSDKIIIENKLNDLFSILLKDHDKYISNNKNFTLNNNINTNIEYKGAIYPENKYKNKNNLESINKFNVKKNNKNVYTKEKYMYLVNESIKKSPINNIDKETSNYKKKGKKNSNKIPNYKNYNEILNDKLSITFKNFNLKEENKKCYESCFLKYKNNETKNCSENLDINKMNKGTLSESVDYYLLFFLLNNEEDYYFLHYIFSLIFIYYKYKFIINNCFNKDEFFFLSYKKAIFKIVNADNNIAFYFSKFLDFFAKEINLSTCYDNNVDMNKSFLKFFNNHTIKKKYYNLNSIIIMNKKSNKEDNSIVHLIKKEQGNEFISKSKHLEKNNNLSQEGNKKYSNFNTNVHENKGINEIKNKKKKIKDNKNINTSNNKDFLNNNLKKKKSNSDKYYYYEIFENKNYSITFLKSSLILCTLKLLQNNNKKILSHYKDINCFVNFYLSVKRKNAYDNNQCNFYDFITMIYYCKNKKEKKFCKRFLKDIFKIFHFIEDKNEVEYYCRKFLTKRLFNEINNESVEKYIIKIFNNIEGDNYVYSMKNMMCDFTKYNSNLNKISSVDRKNANILFLRNINWLYDKYEDILLNDNIKNYINSVTEELLNTHYNIKIEWIFHLSYGQLIFEINKKKYIIHCHMYVLTILLLFNKKVENENVNQLNNQEINVNIEKKESSKQTIICNKLDINYIHGHTKIKRENIKSILNLLVMKYKILLNEVSKKNNDTIDLYYVNFNFSSKNEVIFIIDEHIDPAKIKKEKKNYIYNSEQHLTYEQYLIEAYIIKYVKKNGSTDIKFLIDETEKHFNHSNINSEKINNSIIHLISMDYLKKTESGILEYI
ncbi:cullin, putative [Plasmodium relictum]|uniref:Cullin, putative n=1 Tax=Plasmodium relictum TaxID=85471 RepID=A0A1J1H771_PLARL|nr:cullin, putative [Plasmodium relictum]CRH00636.1 cullin, putative [Plasmodium relictum]